MSTSQAILRFWRVGVYQDVAKNIDELPHPFHLFSIRCQQAAQICAAIANLYFR